MALEFRESDHSYRLDNRVLPSVTQVIRAVLPGWQAGEYFMQRGRALHHACRIIDEGRQLDWDTVSPEILPRVQAWQKFREQWPAKVTRTEFAMASKTYGFAGTCDRVFQACKTITIADLKSSIEPQVAIQLGGYATLWKCNADGLPNATEAVAIELQDSGDFRTFWLNASELRRAEQQFSAVLTTYNFMAANNLLPKE